MGSLDLKVHCRCFPAVLFDLILYVLPFVERAQSCALDCGDVDEHVLAARLRLKGNPAGRLRGSRNKLSEAVICALLRDFSKHGEKAIAKVRRTQPAFGTTSKREG